MQTTKNTKKKIDPFVISSIIVAVLSMLGSSVFVGVGQWGSPLVLKELIHYQRTWDFFMLISLILMTIGVIRSKVKNNTRHLGFALTISIVAVESFIGFSWIAFGALIIVIAYISTYKLWKNRIFFFGFCETTKKSCKSC
jgi:hypothetical protein